MDVSSSQPTIISFSPTPSTLLGLDIHSEEFRAWLLEEFARSTFNSEGSFSLFRTLRAETLALDPSRQLMVWRRALDVIRERDSQSYRDLHKGEPFYWMALAGYAVHDFESALFCLDCALAEDIRNHSARWRSLPAGLFVTLNETNPAQAGLSVVKAIRTVFDEACSVANAQFNFVFNVSEYRSRLVVRTTNEQGQLRSALTALITFLLEYADRRWQLLAAPANADGTAEPFLLHLFKGCVLFETLLKVSDFAPTGQKLTLSGLLTHRPLFNALCGHQPASLGEFASVDELFRKLGDKRRDNSIGPCADVRVTWALRNLIGHNLALPSRPTLAQYEELFALVFSALARSISRLYPPRPIP